MKPFWTDRAGGVPSLACRRRVPAGGDGPERLFRSQCAVRPAQADAGASGGFRRGFAGGVPVAEVSHVAGGRGSPGKIAGTPGAVAARRSICCGLCDVACCQGGTVCGFSGVGAGRSRRLCFIQGDADSTDEGPARVGRRAAEARHRRPPLPAASSPSATMRPAGSRNNSASISPATPRSCGWGCRSTIRGRPRPWSTPWSMPTWRRLWRRSGRRRIQRLDALDSLYVEKETELRRIRNNVRQVAEVAGTAQTPAGGAQPADRPRRGGRGTQGTFGGAKRFAAGAGGAEGRRNPIGQPQEHRGARL